VRRVVAQTLTNRQSLAPIVRDPDFPDGRPACRCLPKAVAASVAASKARAAAGGAQRRLPTGGRRVTGMPSHSSTTPFCHDATHGRQSMSARWCWRRRQGAAAALFGVTTASVHGGQPSHSRAEARWSVDLIIAFAPSLCGCRHGLAADNRESV